MWTVEPKEMYLIKAQCQVRAQNRPFLPETHVAFCILASWQRLSSNPGDSSVVIELPWKQGRRLRLGGRVRVKQGQILHDSLLSMMKTTLLSHCPQTDLRKSVNAIQLSSSYPKCLLFIEIIMEHNSQQFHICLKMGYKIYISYSNIVMVL